MDELKIILKRAIYSTTLEREYRELQRAGRSDNFEGMLGTRDRMQVVFNRIRKVATATATAGLVTSP